MSTNITPKELDSARAVHQEMREYLDQDVEPGFDVIEKWADRLAVLLGLLATQPEPGAEGHRSKYTELDAAIVLAIHSGLTTLNRLVHACDEHIKVIDSRGHSYTDEGLLDRRLQALRKAGRVKFAKGHWSIS